MIRIIYHSADLDGAASGAIARVYHEYEEGKAYTMHPYSYGQPFFYDEFERGDTLYFLDVTFQPIEEMKQFEEKYGWKIYVVDHHPTVVNTDIKDYIHGGVLEIGKSGCELAWDYFFTGIKMPPHIKMLGRYDVWDNEDKIKWNNKIIPFQHGMKMYDTNPMFDDSMTFLWDHLHYLWVTSQDRDNPKSGRYYHMYNEFIDETLYKGKIISKYQKGLNRYGMSAGSFEAELDGHKVLAANTFIKNSQFFESKWDEEKYDFMLAYSYNGKYGDYGCSLYTTRNDLDGSKIAQKYGGGGHKQAAGFGCKEVKVIDGRIEIIK